MTPEHFSFGLLYTWNHTVQVLDVVLRDAALCADLVDEASDEPHHRVSDVAVLRVLEAAFCVEAFRNTAGDAVKSKEMINITSFINNNNNDNNIPVSYQILLK